MKKTLILIPALIAGFALSGCKDKEPTRENCTIQKLIASKNSEADRVKFEGACLAAGNINFEEFKADKNTCGEAEKLANGQVRDRVKNICLMTSSADRLKKFARDFAR